MSTGRHASLNLATHVGDAPGAVAENRRRVRQALNLPSEPLWLNQVHGTRVIQAERMRDDTPCTADAAISREAGRVLAVLTADCLPVVLAACDGSAVAVAHAGWRGLAGGVIEAAVAALRLPGSELTAWLGPCIGPGSYEVGAEVRSAFAGSPGGADSFRPSGRPGHWFCDLPALARARLAALGVSTAAGGHSDTFAEPERFYSYRRDGETGRMASLVWLTSAQ